MTETLNTRAPVLRLKNVHRTYHTGEGSLTVLKGANLDLRPGEMTALKLQQPPVEPLPTSF